MPVDVKAILEAAKPKPILDEQVMGLARIAQANRTYARAKELREQQEYNTLAIAEGEEVAGSVNFMDNIADIDLAIGEIANMSNRNKGNKIVQASLTKIKGGLEETKELSEGRNLAVESLSDLSDDVYQMHESRAKDGIYNEAAVTDLIKSAKNYVNTNAHYLDAALRKDYTTKIDELVKTRNIYNMIDFYDKEQGGKIQFENDPSQPNYLSSMQRGLLQQAKNYADTGNIPDAVKSISNLAAVGTAEARYTTEKETVDFARKRESSFRSQIESINREIEATQGLLGKGVETGAELPLDRGFKKSVGGFKVGLPPDPNDLVDKGGLETVNLAIRQQSDMLNEILKQPAEGPGWWNLATLDNIQLDESHAQAFGLQPGSSLKEVYDAYQSVVTDEEKEPYMDLLTFYLADPKYTDEITSGFHGGVKLWGTTKKERNAAKVMVGSARAYQKLKTLRQEHFLDFPIGDIVTSLQDYGQGGIQFQWPQP